MGRVAHETRTHAALQNVEPLILNLSASRGPLLPYGGSYLLVIGRMAVQQGDETSNGHRVW